MADFNEMNTFDNKAYFKSGDEDRNRNEVKSCVSKAVESQESAKNNKFANLNEEETRLAKRGIYKNVVVISFAFMLLFTAFQSMANLQSSINKVST